MPVCSNCGGNDFVWAENLKTGTIGRGTLSLRSGGELAMGTRVCRGCGHADLFVKDPTVLRQPHTWRPGEFVAMPPRSGSSPASAGPAPAAPMPSAPAPPVSVHPTPSPPSVPPSPGGPPLVAPTPSAPPTLPPPRAEPTAPPDLAATAPGPAEPDGPVKGTSAKKPPRRKAAKGKTGGSTILQE